MTTYLLFPNELQAQAVMADYLPKGAKGFPSYIGDIACQSLGVVADSDASTLEGWIIMLSASIPALMKYEIKPDFPIQSFGNTRQDRNVPFEIARWQAKMTLIMSKDANGVSLWDKVLALHAAVDDPILQVSMDAALYDVSSWQRASPTVNKVAQNLGLSPTEVDELFISAHKLVL